MNAATPSSAQTAKRELTADERAYLLARLVVLAALGLLWAIGYVSPTNPSGHSLFLIATGLLAFDTGLILYSLYATRLRVSRAVMLVFPLDLIGMGILTFLSGSEDAFFAVMIVTPVLLALIVSKRDAWIASGLLAATYLGAQVISHPWGFDDFVLIVLKSLAIVFVSMLVANSVEKRREREEDAEEIAAETENLNDVLRRRVHELQAVGEVTELVHSSLDFDQLGPQVLEILAQAVRVGDCCLFIIDKNKSETLFSASRGPLAPITSPLSPSSALLGDEHLTCIPVYDRSPIMVLFCASATEIASLTEDDRLVLGAVANELVVAAENARLYALTSHLAITDELTGLSNYRNLQRSLDEELARSKRYDRHLSLIMIDADDFKRFNDTQGHLAGDYALADLGAILRTHVREVDLVARYGGEEFAVVLPETDVAGAFVVAEKIREAVELHRFADAEGHRACRMTVSLGVATFPTHGDDKESLLREADDALYHAKNGGKNRVRAPERHGAHGTDDTAAIQQDDLTGV